MVCSAAARAGGEEAASLLLRVDGTLVCCLRVAWEWLQSREDFTDRQKRLEHYGVRISAAADRYLVWFQVKHVPEEADLRGGSTPRGRDFELSLSKQDLAVVGHTFFK
jgi:hypothetical protein